MFPIGARVALDDGRHGTVHAIRRIYPGTEHEFVEVCIHLDIPMVFCGENVYWISVLPERVTEIPTN